MDKEELEQELKNLKNRFTILSNQAQNIKNELLSVNNELLITKGAISQTEKMLAFYNNNTGENPEEKEKEEN